MYVFPRVYRYKYRYVCVCVCVWVGGVCEHMCIFASEYICKSKVGDFSRGWPEGSIFNSYYTEV